MIARRVWPRTTNGAPAPAFAEAEQWMPRPSGPRCERAFTIADTAPCATAFDVPPQKIPPAIPHIRDEVSGMGNHQRDRLLHGARLLDAFVHPHQLRSNSRPCELAGVFARRTPPRGPLRWILDRVRESLAERFVDIIDHPSSPRPLDLARE